LFQQNFVILAGTSNGTLLPLSSTQAADASDIKSAPSFGLSLVRERSNRR